MANNKSYLEYESEFEWHKSETISGRMDITELRLYLELKVKDKDLIKIMIAEIIKERDELYLKNQMKSDRIILSIVAIGFLIFAILLFVNAIPALSSNNNYTGLEVLLKVFSLIGVTIFYALSKTFRRKSISKYGFERNTIKRKWK